MKREDIEKVADEFANKEYEISYIDRIPLYKGFYHGAEWHINSVWHSNNRTYKAQKPALVIFKNGKAKVYDNLTDLTIESLWGEVDRFAYIEDLLPNMED